MRARSGKTLTLLELVLAVSLLLIGSYTAAAGHFTRHMLVHLGLMAVLAPLAASWMQRHGWQIPGVKRGGFLMWATIAQLLLFFLWHSPAVMTRMMVSPALAATMYLALWLAAAAFWSSIFEHTCDHVWRPVVALLLTGKLFCLVALILVFAPRVLYSSPNFHSFDLADQQLAGLLMIAICPLTYVLTAILLLVRWLDRLAEEPLETPLERRAENPIKRYAGNSIEKQAERRV